MVHVPQARVLPSPHSAGVGRRCSAPQDFLCFASFFSEHLFSPCYLSRSDIYIAMRWLVAAAAAGSALLSLPAGASKLTPPVVPLAVRNPYLSTWLGDVRETPWNKWPMFWTGEEVRLSLMRGKQTVVTR